MTDKEQKTLLFAEAQAKVNGVAAIRVKDGEVFVFDVAYLQRVINQNISDNKETLVIFVKSGSDNLVIQ